MFEIVVVVFVVVCIFAIAVKKSHPAQVKGLRALTAKHCPSCRTPIAGSATHCPHCAQPTGWVKNKTRWDRLKSKRDW